MPRALTAPCHPRPYRPAKIGDMMIKLGILAIKTVTKPIAKNLKVTAAENPVFRDMCVGVGRFVNQSTQRLNVWIMGHKVTNVRKISEVEAVNRGAEVLSEGMIFGVAGALIFAEYERKEWQDGKKKAAAAEKKKDEDDAIARRFEFLQNEVSEIRGILLRAEREREMDRQEKRRAAAAAAAARPSWWWPFGGGAAISTMTDQPSPAWSTT